EQKVGPITVQQCELTYINEVIQGKGWETFQESSALFEPWWKDGTDGFLPKPESLSISGAFQMPDERGRLHFNAQHVRRQLDDREAIQLQFVARGAPSS